MKQQYASLLMFLYSIVGVCGNLTAQTKKEITFGFDKGYPPFEFVDEDGKAKGFNIDMLKAIGEVQGLEVKLKPAPWPQVKSGLVDEGTIDVAAMFIFESRSKLVDYTDPFTIIYHEIYSRDSLNQVNKLEDLKGKSVILQAETFIHDFFISNDFDNEIVLAATESEALRTLASGKYDFAVVSQGVGFYQNQIRASPQHQYCKPSNCSCKILPGCGQRKSLFSKKIE